MTDPRGNTPAAPGVLGDISGAMADFGTFLPLVLGMLALGRFDAAGILAGFGVFALAVAVFYRRPIPVQPMKAIAALAIVGALSPGQMMASGMIIAAVLLVLASGGIINRIARMVPGTVIAGIQLGVGAQLAMIGFQHMVSDPVFGLAALALLAAMFFTHYRAVSCIIVFVLGAAASIIIDPGQLSGVGTAWALPAVTFPVRADFESALVIAVLPQLALTLSNAVIATSAIAATCFPAEKPRFTPARLAASTGVLNLILAPFGAMPMCHGSGGLVAQYGFGARTWITPALFGGFCLALGLAFGDNAAAILGVLPLSALGAMLCVAGTEMALGRRLFDAKPSCRLVIIATGIACVAFNVATGLLIGFVLEAARSAYFRARHRHQTRGRG